jgi:hypothetical protein
MLSVGHAGPITTGNTQENADDLASATSYERNRRRASRLRWSRAPAADGAMQFTVHNAHAVANLLAGIREPKSRNPCPGTHVTR